MNKTTIPSTDRQTAIPGWNQAALDTAHIGVVGRGWIASFFVWAMLCLGVKRITWVGSVNANTQKLDRWIIDKFSTGRIYECDFDPESTFQLQLPLGHCHCIMSCTESIEIRSIARTMARNRSRLWLEASLARGGQLSSSQPLAADHAVASRYDPVLGMGVAATLAEWIVSKTALSDRPAPPEGRVELPSMEVGTHPKRVLLIGAGGIGSVAAVGLLAVLASAGIQLHIVDCDSVEASNLNRQFFTADDALKGVAKSTALHNSLAELFPQACVSSSVQRLDDSYVLDPAWVPDAIVSAVDNAKTRVILMKLAQGRSQLVQGATSIHAAEARTQLIAGPTIDQQMLGALLEAQSRESTRRTGNCGMPSYVVPSLFAGCLVVNHILRLPNASNCLSWRSGGTIKENLL